MRKQAREIVPAEGGERRTVLLRHERVLAACLCRERLMQMPAGGKHVRQLGPAHEGRVIAVAARDLLHSTSKQHHVVGGLDPFAGSKGELALARAELGLAR